MEFDFQIGVFIFALFVCTTSVLSLAKDTWLLKAVLGGIVYAFLTGFFGVLLLVPVFLFVAWYGQRRYPELKKQKFHTQQTGLVKFQDVIKNGVREGWQNVKLTHTLTDEQKAENWIWKVNHHNPYKSTRLQIDTPQKEITSSK